jgi:hypothetical protein
MGQPPEVGFSQRRGERGRRSREGNIHSHALALCYLGRRDPQARDRPNLYQQMNAV